MRMKKVESKTMLQTWSYEVRCQALIFPLTWPGSNNPSTLFKKMNIHVCIWKSNLEGVREDRKDTEIFPSIIAWAGIGWNRELLSGSPTGLAVVQALRSASGAFPKLHWIRIAAARIKSAPRGDSWVTGGSNFLKEFLHLINFEKSVTSSI